MENMMKMMREHFSTRTVVIKQSLDMFGIKRNEDGTLLFPRHSDKRFPIASVSDWRLMAGEENACFTLEEVCDLTEKAIEAHFYRTPTEPNEMEYASLRHIDGYEWFREGEDVVQLIEVLLQIRHELADDIQQLLEYRHSGFDSDEMGLETEFARESCYAERRQVSTARLDSMWINFVSPLKTESRFINNAVSSTLDGIFRGVETMRARGKEPVIMHAGPGTQISTQPFLSVDGKPHCWLSILVHPLNRISSKKTSRVNLGD